MAKIEDSVGTDARTLQPWVAPQIIASDASDTAANQLPTFWESTVPTDRPS